MAHVLDPLAGDPRLLETLSRFLDLDLDRTRTAAAMGLSRRGLSLRLDRVTALTGFDPRGARGVQVLSSALASRALIALREAG
jgi:carbohydrate diacid regulator